MLEFTEIISTSEIPVLTTLTLPLELRQKSRQRVTLDNGKHAGLFLKRGTTLLHDDLLRASTGEVVRVCAASERLSMVRCNDPLLFAQACYHLGNRHVLLQINEGVLYYPCDHVLDSMLRNMGLSVEISFTPFQPENGAYFGSSIHVH